MQGNLYSSQEVKEIGNTKGEKSVEQKIKNYLSLEWSFSYVEEDGTLLLIFAKNEGKRKIELGRTYTID